MENCLAISKKNYVALKRSHYPFLSRIHFCATYPSRFRLRLMIAPPSVTKTSRGCVAADVALDTGRRCRHVWAGGRKRVRALPSLSSAPPPAIPPPTGSTVNRLYIMTEAPEWTRVGHMGARRGRFPSGAPVHTSSVVPFVQPRRKRRAGTQRLAQAASSKSGPRCDIIKPTATFSEDSNW